VNPVEYIIKHNMYERIGHHVRPLSIKMTRARFLYLNSPIKMVETMVYKELVKDYDINKNSPATGTRGSKTT
jgi:hypothetical protein